MKRNPYKGAFVVVEGLDGAGQSTQIEMLEKSLKDLGYPIAATKEPTNNVIGGLIRGQLTHDWTASMECLQLLFAADRAHHLDRFIIPALKAGNVVVSDRYFFSNIAFGSPEINREWLVNLNERFIYPDITFLLKVPAETCIKRMEANRFELELFEKKEKLARVWRTYEYLAKKYPRVKVIDGTQSITQISGEIIELTKKALKEKKIVPKRNLV